MDTQNIRIVPITSLVRNPNDKRNRTSPAYRAWVVELAADIRDRGIRNPLLVMQDTILAGMTRWEAAQLAGLTDVPVNILDRPLSKGDMLREQLLENEMRRDFNDLERAEMYAALMTENAWSQADLARELRISAGRVSKVMAVSAKLPEDLQALIGQGDGRIPPTSAYQLSRLQTPEAMHELAEKIMAGLLKRDHVEREVNKRLGKRQPKAKSVKGRIGAVLMTFPGDFSWDGIGETAHRLLDLARRGAKTGISPAAALPSLLRG